MCNLQELLEFLSKEKVEKHKKGFMGFETPCKKNKPTLDCFGGGVHGMTCWHNVA